MLALTIAAGLTAATAAAGSTVLLAPLPSRASPARVEVRPSTINAGLSLSLRGTCGPGVSQATATSNAFGVTTLYARQDDSLAGVATVPEHTRPRGYLVKLQCPSGRTAGTTLWVVNPTKPARGPDTGGGALAERDSGPMLLAGGLSAIGAGVALAAIARRRRRTPTGA